MVVVPIIACSASGDGANITDDPQPDPTSQLPGADGSTTPEGSTPRDGSANDAGKDSGPPPPNPGDPCPVENAKFTKPCGKCGTQTALCLEKKVTEYGVCENETGVCNPGEQAECGKCGKQTCTQYCIWGGCGGEKTGPTACFAGQFNIESAGCPGTGWRTAKCKADCSDYETYSACSMEPFGPFTLTVPGTIGQTASAVFPLRATYKENRITGTCDSAVGTLATLSTTYQDPVSYITLNNPTGQTVTASVWGAAASSTTLVPQIVLAWYSGGPPAKGDDAARRACAKGVPTTCPTALANECKDSKSGLGVSATASLNKAAVIPPGGSVTLYVASYTSSSAGTPGDVRIVVCTEVLN